jgi:hypothetical protein
VLEEREAGSPLGRHAREVSAVWIVGPHFLAPPLEREWRVGDRAAEGGQPVSLEECGGPSTNRPGLRRVILGREIQFNRILSRLTRDRNP